MQDQWVRCRAAFGLEYIENGVVVVGVSGQAIDGFGRDRNGFATLK